MNTEVGGYYIHGGYTTVAWYKTKEEAEAMCRKMNYRGDCYYKVIPSYCQKNRDMSTAKV